MNKELANSWIKTRWRISNEIGALWNACCYTTAAEVNLRYGSKIERLMFRVLFMPITIPLCRSIRLKESGDGNAIDVKLAALL